MGMDIATSMVDTAMGMVILGGEKHEYGKVSEPSTGDAEGWCALDMCKGMHNIMVPVAPKILTAFDLSCYKSALDLGGISIITFSNIFCVCNWRSKNNRQI